MNLKGKVIVLGITGGIAAYKMANVASALRKTGAEVHVIMTKNATEFITPLTFETLTDHKCVVDTFARDFAFDVAHISLAKKADLFLVAPATANVMAKLAHGIADDMLTTTLLAARCPKLIAPAMNTAMYEAAVTQDNMQTLVRYGYEIIEPESGMLACKDVGKGKLPHEEVLLAHVARALCHEKDMAGMKLTVTAGATQEALDPVRYLTNHSTGKMGYAIAKAAMLRGADVTLIHGKTALEAPLFIKDIAITSAADLHEAVAAQFAHTDVLIMAAAVADYRPETVATQKMKKKEGELALPLARTVDVLGTLAPQKTGQFVCGFAMETENLLENARAKLEKKNLDMIVANSLRTEGAGFGGDTNVVTILTKDGAKALPLLSKDDVADALLDEIVAARGGAIVR